MRGGVLLLLLLTSLAHPASVQLAWDLTDPAQVDGCKVYHGTQSRVYDHSDDVGFVTSATVEGLEPGVEYVFAVTAYNTVAESAFSNEVRYRVPSTLPDTTPPTVRITSPDPGFVPRRSTITIEAEATDDSGIDHVDCYVNGGWLCTDEDAPYTCAFTVSRSKHRTYALQCEAFDAVGLPGLSEVVEVMTR